MIVLIYTRVIQDIKGYQASYYVEIQVQKYIQTIAHWDLPFGFMEANLFPTTYTHSFQHHQYPRIIYASYFRTFTWPEHTKTQTWLENIHTCDAHDIKWIRFPTTQIITETMDIQGNYLEYQCSPLNRPPDPHTNLIYLLQLPLSHGLPTPTFIHWI